MSIPAPAARRLARDLDIAYPAAEPQSTSNFTGVKGAILAQLDEFERLFVVLYYAEHMSSAEIAEVMEIGADEVNDVHRFVLRKLRSSVSVSHAA
jgi:DNA-directed RNA polymerase specialized sigma subunit